MKIEVLYFTGCPHAEAAIAEVERALRETKISADIRQTAFSEEAARARGFAGSPTILVNGKDVEESGENSGRGLSCRIYSDGRFVPAQDSIQRALRNAKLEEER